MKAARKTAGDLQGASGRYRPSSERPPFVPVRKTGTRRKPKRIPKALATTAPTHGAGVSGRF